MLAVHHMHGNLMHTVHNCTICIIAEALEEESVDEPQPQNTQIISSSCSATAIWNQNKSQFVLNELLKHFSFEGFRESNIILVQEKNSPIVFEWTSLQNDIFFWLNLKIAIFICAQLKRQTICNVRGTVFSMSVSLVVLAN